MGENLRLKERAAVRTPMQWSPDRNGGFSTADRLVRPTVEGQYGPEFVNVKQQRRERDSLLRWTIRMIRLRKECPEIGWGAWEILATGARAVLAIRYEWRGTTVLCAHNFSPEPQRIRLRVDGALDDLVEDEQFRPSRGSVHELVLDGYGFRWFRVGEGNTALGRSRA
jgi:maltose alpha-D-glucosyltransferase/alpha-amylase